MKQLSLENHLIGFNSNLLSQIELDFELSANKDLFDYILLSPKNDVEKVLGWMDIPKLTDGIRTTVNEKAYEIRQNADFFILIGVGGSNQGSRAVVKALGHGGPEILYAGNNLSSRYISDILEKIKGKSVYINVIAKNFETLEPGLGFRFFRDYMNKFYGETEAAKRIIATGSYNGILEKLAKECGYMFLPFPENVGGRFSVMSAVGLMPIAVSGADIDLMINGALDMLHHINEDPYKNDAFKYAAIRNILYKKGKNIEILSCFDPALEFFLRWWVQLFGESEGKDNKGIFPTTCSLTEDLHSIGQYIQSGGRNLTETFLWVDDIGTDIQTPVDPIWDGFGYLDGKSLAWINKNAYEATVKAHMDGNSPCMTIKIPQLNEYYFGQLFYFFEMACYASAKILGVNPFNQPGVEDYKNNMFIKLGKSLTNDKYEYTPIGQDVHDKNYAS